MSIASINVIQGERRPRGHRCYRKRPRAHQEVSGINELVNNKRVQGIDAIFPLYNTWGGGGGWLATTKSTLLLPTPSTDYYDSFCRFEIIFLKFFFSDFYNLLIIHHWTK